MRRAATSVLLACSLGMALGLNSNGIRSSKETQESSEQVHSLPGGSTSEIDAGTTQTVANNRPIQRTCSTGQCGSAEPGFCCVRYLTAKRCQRIPLEGDACLLPGRAKRRRNLERCNCGDGLYCGSPAGLTEAAAAKKQGVCLSRPGQGRRNKKRRTAEDDC
ncbi:unnamed protein product [Merluccius merluccius]